MTHQLASFLLPQDVIEAITEKSKQTSQTKTEVVVKALRQALALPTLSSDHPSQNEHINGNGHTRLADNDPEFDSLVTLLRQASVSVVSQHPSAKTLPLANQARQHQQILKNRMAMLLVGKEKLTKKMQTLQRKRNEVRKHRHELAEQMLIIRGRFAHSSKQNRENKKQAGLLFQHEGD